jgi:N-methylhydantoinase A
VFSAFGLLVAETEHHAVRSLRMRIDEPDAEAVAATLAALTKEGERRLEEDGFVPSRRNFARSAMARYVGQSSEIAVALPPGSAADVLRALPGLFAAEHERTYGFRAPPEEPVELVGLSVVARGVPERPRLPETIPPARSVVPQGRLAWFPGSGWLEVPVTGRADLAERGRTGPLIVQEYDATCLVPDGAKAAVDSFGTLRIALASG